MTPRRIRLRRADKLTVPGVYESSAVELEIEYELTDEDEVAAVQAAKQRLDAVYWPLLAVVYNEFLGRVRSGTAAFLTPRINRPGP